MTNIILASELLAEGLNKAQIAKRLGVSRRTVIRWFQAITEHGSFDAFLAYYQQAKTGPRTRRKTDALDLGDHCSPILWLKVGLPRLTRMAAWKLPFSLFFYSTKADCDLLVYGLTPRIDSV